jgi:hypothetical protein
MYQNHQFWYNFLAWEHTARRRSTFPGDYQPWEAFPSRTSPPDKEDKEEDDNDDFDVKPTRPWRTPSRRAPRICPRSTRWS